MANSVAMFTRMYVGIYIYLEESLFFLFISYILLFVFYWDEAGEMIINTGELDFLFFLVDDQIVFL